jgi:S1-C subfamily serine protease
MKKYRQIRGGARISMAVFLSALTAAPLMAQQTAPAAASPAPAATPAVAAAATTPAAPASAIPLITLPATWKMTSQPPVAPAPPPGPVPSTDAQSSQIVLTAAPVDTKRDGTLSIYSYRFHVYAPPLTEDAGIDAETGKFVQQLLVQGFTPTLIVSRHTASLKSEPLLTIEIVARNAAGAQRIFTDSMMVAQVAEGANNYRMYTSRPREDTGSGEIEAMIKSLDVPVAVIPQNFALAKPTLPPGTTSQEAAQIVQDYHGALVIVEGKKGLGSGFLCGIDGHTYIITNAHVLADNAGVKLTNLDGVAFTSGSSAVAVDHDIVKMEVGATPKTFEIMTNLDSTVKIGDAVMIPGNAEGAKVVTTEEGKIIGIGPNLIEVDAPFVPGNSGSPIIHVASGKVLGVATYMMIKSVDKGGGNKVVEEVRRFGYRLDSVKTWQPINWQAFYAESQQLSAIEELSDDFITMFDKGDKFSASDCKNPVLAREVRDFVEAHDKGDRASLSRADEETLRQNFFSQLRTTTQADINAFNSRPAYDYFRREVEKQGRLRSELFDIFTRILQND